MVAQGFPRVLGRVLAVSVVPMVLSLKHGADRHAALGADGSFGRPAEVDRSGPAIPLRPIGLEWRDPIGPHPLRSVGPGGCASGQA